jgi:hypothetical protein
MSLPRIIPSSDSPTVRSLETAEKRLARVAKTLKRRKGEGKQGNMRLRVQVQVLDPECALGDGMTRPRYMGLRGMGFVVEVADAQMAVEVEQALRAICQP